MKNYLPTSCLLACVMILSAGAQEMGKPGEPAKAPLKRSELPRDENGLLKPEVWDIVAEGAKANPSSNDARAMQSRDTMKQYYATFSGWKAPEPPALAPGKLRNLSETPTAPRFPLTGKAWPEKVGGASVCLWEDDKLAAMTFGVDDNCATDIPYWKELSKKYGGVSIIFNLITSNIDGAMEKARGPMAGTWETWREMIKEGYHVTSHSMVHCNDPVPADGWPGYEWEAAESKRMMDANLGGFITKVFTYPGAGVGAFSTPVDPKTKQTAQRPAVVKYYAAARGGGALAINQANMIDYFDIHSTTSGVVYLLDDSKLDGWMKRAHISQNLNTLFDPDPNNKNYRGWANVFIHFINNGKDFDTNPFQVEYGKVMAFYNEHRADLWTGYLDDIALYGQERDTATLVTDEAGDAKISFTLTSKMDPVVFDYPLTVKVRIPGAWKNVKARQAEKDIPAVVIQHEGASFALVKAIPDRGQVTLLPP